ncbi:lysozyme [Pontibacter qinzhouensis]|uniref:Lysozyme n=1 Tax=Pontibacter qinzhouensis TaxID=2603253 RepID=A0A5C8KAP9_9BACT|nr:GH25 family lysozyme [Pontibacter qinzhouensis]TXK46746.1 lysozyme [Pontibacter qinzhouensis]
MFFAFLLLVSQKLTHISLLFMAGFVSLLSTSEPIAKDDDKATATTTKVSSLKGIDVSRWQHEVDWHQVKEADITFAFVKASQSDCRQDPYFERNWQETKRVGIKRGAYHFFIPTVPAIEQVKIFKNLVRLEAGDLPPVLDVEVAAASVSGEQFREQIRIWLEAIEDHYGMKPMIYSNQNFYRRWLKGHFNDYSFWIARYNTAQPVLHQTDKWAFWQYTDRGTLPGIKAAVDLNFFPGDYETLHALCQPELPAPKEDLLQQLKHRQPLP